MKKRICENCNAFVPIGRKGPDGSETGECRADSPQIVSSWVTPQGSSWQGGWPPTTATQWCRQYQEQIILSVVGG